MRAGAAIASDTGAEEYHFTTGMPARLLQPALISLFDKDFLELFAFLAFCVIALLGACNTFIPWRTAAGSRGVAFALGKRCCLSA